MHSRRLDINGTVFLRSIFIDWTQALIAIENTVTVSTDNDFLFLFFAVVVLLYRPINKEGGPNISFCLCHDKR